jgi:hypothetical protein
MARAQKCGFITHVKGSATKPKAHKSFAEAVEHAKAQTKPTGVLSVCGRNVRRLALCSSGECGSSSSSLSGVRRRAKARKVARKAVRKARVTK